MIDLGSGFSLRFAAWKPDRTIKENRVKYIDIPDVEKHSAILTCRHGEEGYITFDHGEKINALFPDSPKWKVESWEPLTISPSVDCGCCHGFIKNGKWSDA